jgi:hypothetical protein
LKAVPTASHKIALGDINWKFTTLIASAVRHFRLKL